MYFPTFLLFSDLPLEYVIDLFLIFLVFFNFLISLVKLIGHLESIIHSVLAFSFVVYVILFTIILPENPTLVFSSSVSVEFDSFLILLL